MSTRTVNLKACCNPFSIPLVDKITDSVKRIKKEYEFDELLITIPVAENNCLLEEGSAIIELQTLDENTSPLNCLMCLKKYSENDITPQTAKTILTAINEERLSNNFLCPQALGCDVLEYSASLSLAINVYISDMYRRNYFDLITPDNVTAPVFAEASDLNIKFSFPIIIKKPMLSWKKDSVLLNSIKETLFNTTELYKALLDPIYDKIGIGIFGNVFTEEWLIVIFLVQTIEETEEVFEYPKLADACLTCTNNIHFSKKTYDTSRGQISISEMLYFRYTVPSICNIYAISLVGDIAGERYRYVINPSQVIQEGQSPILLGGRSFDEPLLISPVPGEFFTVFAYFYGIEDFCNPVPIAAGFFAHHCWTSGTIKKILLYEEGEIVAEIDSGSTPEDWVGESGLAYEIVCEGKPKIIAPSDFKTYSVDERVFVQKKGIRVDEAGTAEETCQDPPVIYADLTLKDTNVYSFKEDGIIAPFSFYGV